MKLRLGFVSNSSSSSFVMLCNRVEFKDLNLKDIRGREIKALGKYLGDGQDFFRVDEEIFNCIKENNQVLEHLCFYEVFAEGDDDIEIERKDLPEKGSLHIISTTVDYHCSDDLSLFKENYLENE